MNPLLRQRLERFPMVLLAMALAAPAMAQSRNLEIITHEGGGSISYLGIEMEDVTAENLATYKLSAERGVIVRSVQKGSPAEAATLQEKDVILEYGGTAVYSTMQFARMVRETPVGRKVDLGVSRDGRKIALSATIGKREGPAVMSEGRRLYIEPREFGFEGPGGRRFRFESPEGRGFSFNLPAPEFSAREGKPRLGVTLQGLTDQMGEFLGVPGKKGVLITSVMDGSAAAAANLKTGDVIIKADDRAVDEPEDLVRILDRKEADAKLELKVIREKRELTIVVELPREGKKTSGFRL